MFNERTDVQECPAVNTRGMDHQDWIVQTLERFENRLLWYAARLPGRDEHVGKLLQLKGQTARYVRLHSNGNTANDRNHYIEVEIRGRKAK